MVIYNKLVDYSGDYIVDYNGDNISEAQYEQSDFNVQFFKPNKLDANTTYSFTSADTDFAYYLYDRNKNVALQSSGSDDSTPEVWEFTFSAAKTINGIAVIGHNIKQGNIQYWSGSAWVNFVNTVWWSDNTDVNSYFTFTEVSTTKIRLTMNTTISSNAEKEVAEILILESWGTVSVNPVSTDIDFPSDTNVVNTLSNGGNVYIDFGEKYADTLRFLEASSADMEFLRDMKNSIYPFWVYMCGGYDGNTQEGFRVQDFYFCNWINSFKPTLKNNLLDIGTDITLRLKEV